MKTENLITAEMVMDFFTATEYYWGCFRINKERMTVLFDGTIDIKELAAYLNKRLEETTN